MSCARACMRARQLAGSHTSAGVALQMFLWHACLCCSHRRLYLSVCRQCLTQDLCAYLATLPLRSPMPAMFFWSKLWTASVVPEDTESRSAICLCSACSEQRQHTWYTVFENTFKNCLQNTDELVYKLIIYSHRFTHFNDVRTIVFFCCQKFHHHLCMNDDSKGLFRTCAISWHQRDNSRAYHPVFKVLLHNMHLFKHTLCSSLGFCLYTQND